MYIKNNFVWERRADLDDVNIDMWIELHIKNSTNILISSIYRPPNGSKFLSKDFFDHFESNLSLGTCLLYTSPSPRDGLLSRMPSSA